MVGYGLLLMVLPICLFTSSSWNIALGSLMADKSSSWCPKCRAPHAGRCPKQKAWSSGKRSGSGRGGRPWGRTRKRIFERDDYLCQSHLRRGLYVSVELHGVNAGICDHIVPLSAGGADDDENLETLCRACSDEKTLVESRQGGG